MDRRDDPSNVAYRVYYTASMDHGKSFAPNTMISDVGSNANQLPDPTYLGNYIGVATDANQVVHVAWNDCRNNQLEAFTSSFSLNQSGVIVASTASASQLNPNQPMRKLARTPKIDKRKPSVPSAPFDWQGLGMS